MFGMATYGHTLLAGDAQIPRMRNVTGAVFQPEICVYSLAWENRDAAEEALFLC